MTTLTAIPTAADLLARHCDTNGAPLDTLTVEELRGACEQLLAQSRERVRFGAFTLRAHIEFDWMDAPYVHHVTLRWSRWPKRYLTLTTARFKALSADLGLETPGF